MSKGTIKSIRRTAAPIEQDVKVRERSEIVSLSSIIRMVQPKIDKTLSRRIAEIPWLNKSYDRHDPGLTSMLTTVIKNVVEHPDDVEDILDVCMKAKTYQEVEWRFPSILHLLVEHKRRVGDLQSTEGGVIMAKPCRKCGTNNWEITFIQKSAADETVHTSKTCLTCK